MSDTSNLASNNIEPSMEDILSSIRKVIAEDLSQKEDGDVQVEAGAESQIETSSSDDIEITATEQIELVDLQSTDQQSEDEEPLDDILELDNLLGDIDELDSETNELMELIQLEDDVEEIPPAEEQVLEILTVPSPSLPETEPAAESSTEQGANFGFDETLDLVMDGDASDYVTENIAAIPAEPQEEQVEASETLSPDEELAKSILDDILLDEQNSDDFEAVEIAQEPEPAQPEPVQEDIQENLNPVSTNDDMDLVKSLLDDLMDEPISETVSEAVETTVAATSFNMEDIFSEEDLLIPDPEAAKEETTNTEAPTIEELIQTAAPSAGEMGTFIETEAYKSVDEVTNIELENEVENELAQLAREIAEVRDIAAIDTVATDDVIELSTPDYASKLAVSASLAGGAALVDDNSDGIIAAAAENDLESLQQLIAETDLTEPTPETPEEIEMIKSPIQEDETMAAPLKTDLLSDANTQQEVGNAFASLTTTVQEHELAEENGPPIGELVKEALRPMLQEWLDKNLKGMVQRAVTKEIKRISSGK